MAETHRPIKIDYWRKRVTFRQDYDYERNSCSAVSQYRKLPWDNDGRWPFYLFFKDKRSWKYIRKYKIDRVAHRISEGWKKIMLILFILSKISELVGRYIGTDFEWIYWLKIGLLLSSNQLKKFEMCINSNFDFSCLGNNGIDKFIQTEYILFVLIEC